MLIIGVSIVKNESDIIESFVRFNSNFLDQMYVIDNGSTDSTPEILNRLAAEWPQLRLAEDRSSDHRQEQILTRVIHELCVDRKFDFVLPLDADEFIQCSGRSQLEAELNTIPAETCGLARWKTYVPTPQDDWSVIDPLRRIVHRRISEPKQYSKVVVPFAVAVDQGFRLMLDNHMVQKTGGKFVLQTNLEGTSLAHFPLRSRDQLASKVLLGEWALNTKIARAAEEAWHWQRLAEKIVENMQLSLEDLRDAATMYASPEPMELCKDPLSVPEDCVMKWPELVNVNLTERVVRFSAAHFKKLATTVFRTDFMAIGKTEFGVLGYHLADTVIGASVKLYGEWATDEVRVLKRFLSRGDSAVDVGANIGTHAVPLAMAVGPNGEVQAFEPQRLSYQMLCANAALNGLTNIHAHQTGLSDSPGAMTVPMPDMKAGGNFGHFRLEEHEQGERVPVVTLDSLSLPTVRLLKIDVEGMESKVLRGGRNLIFRDRPVIFVENNVPDKSAELIRLLIDLGYRCWWHLAEYYNPHNYYLNPTNIFSQVGRPEVNMVCLHGSSEPGVDLLPPVSGPDDTWQAALARTRGSQPS